MAKLFIVGIPKDMQEIELVEMFSVHGIVNTVTIVTDKDSGQPRGYGFITMADDLGAQRAIDALDGAEIDERKISVRFAEDKRSPAPARTGSVQMDNLNKKRSIDKDNRINPLKPKRPRRPL